MTYTLPYELTNAAILIAACLHSGLDLRSELKRRADLLTSATPTPVATAPRVLPPAPPAQPELPVLEFDPAALRLR